MNFVAHQERPKEFSFLGTAGLAVILEATYFRELDATIDKKRGYKNAGTPVFKIVG